MSQPITALHGVGSSLAAKLARLGITHVEDLLFHLPLRYEDRTRITPIGQLLAGESAVIEGVIEACEVRPAKNNRKRSLVCTLFDGTGRVLLRFFHFTQPQRLQLQLGLTLRCFGEVRQGYQCFELIHPEYRLGADDGALTEATPAQLTPVYPSSEGLRQNQLRQLVDQVLNRPAPEYLPPELLAQWQWPALADALQTIHHPPPEVPPASLQHRIHPACRRLAFEELLAHHLSLRLLRQQHTELQAPVLQSEGAMQQQLLAQLPFQLTGAQQRVVAEISHDLVLTQPMLRLVQGDVGSGKTVVAALAAVQAIEAGYQVAIMAPTELLAEQHLRTFSQWFELLELVPVWVSGSLTRKQRELAVARLSSGEAMLAVGTHALFQEAVSFAQLGLVIIDEQHRFGVHQRLALRDKGAQAGIVPHQLIMTATPIPRTLAMTAYADLDSSIIDELPAGRSPVSTAIVPNTRRDEVIERIRLACQQEQRQVYWVCTLIEESETLQCQAAEETAEQLAMCLPMLKTGLVHGRMKAKEKEAVMQQFKAGELDLLVATTVIEVGVDVPNASLMIIENAERLGLSQLHQLRGRVGRGAKQSFCVLLYQAPLSQLAGSRLAIMRETCDGFLIAQRDLELRGPGEMLGTRQTGLLNWRIAELPRDEDLLEQVPAVAEVLLSDPSRCQGLVKRWLGEKWQYGGV